MSAKFVFTNFSYRKSDVELMDIVPETDEDYDVADVFLIDFYSDEGRTVCVESDSFEDAVWVANHLLGTCAAPKNVVIPYDIRMDLLEKYKLKPTFWTDKDYIPAPIKMDEQVGRKRARKYYNGTNNGKPFSPSSLFFDYLTFNHFQVG